MSHAPKRCTTGLTTLRPICLAVAIQALAVSSVQAQLFERATVVRNARIVAPDGSVIEGGAILIKGDSIAAIGKDVKAPMLSKTIDVGGKTVTPGLVDAWSSLGRLGRSRQVDPTANAWDAFDRHARDDFREALRHGVTTVYVGPGGGPGVSGKGVVVQLVPGAGGTAGEVLQEAAALCVNFGSGQPAVERMRTYGGIRKQFRKALEYREALEDYDEDLKEYVEELKKRSEEKEKEEAKEGESKEGEEKKEKGEEKEESKEPPEDDEPTPPDDDDEDGASGTGFADLFTFQRAKTASLRRTASTRAKDDDKNGENDKNGNGKGEGEDKDGEKEEDELTKPTRPTPDPKSDVLLEAIDHKLPVRIEAHRSADILNALELAGEFNLDIILEGATDAYLVADKIADAEVPVVLGQVSRTDLFEPNEFRRHTERNAAALTRAGVRWTAGSGGANPHTARFVGLNAQLASSYHADLTAREDGTGKERWMQTVTSDAAAVLGLAGRIGRLATGMRADLVIWTGDLGDPGSTVDRVFVAGKLAYVAPKTKEGGS